MSLVYKTELTRGELDNLSDVLEFLKLELDQSYEPEHTEVMRRYYTELLSVYDKATPAEMKKDE